MKRNSPTSSIWTWISFIVFGLLILLFGSSLIQKKSPAKILKSLFTKEFVESDLNSYSKEVLIKMVEDQKIQIDSLRRKVNEYTELYGIAMGRINVATDALNMRSLPSISGEVLVRVPNKTMVKIIAFSEKEEFIEGASGRWCMIEYDDQEGWVWGNYVDIVK
jgi:uncharacterized protein YgiM (DUF1202 family)